MEDETGKDGAFRPCLHEFETNLFEASIVPIHGFNVHSGNYHIGNLAGSSILTDVLALRAVPDIDWEEKASIALSHMIPRLNRGSSIVNFALELKDLKRTNPLPSIKRVYNRRLAFRHLRDPKKRKEFFKELNSRLTSAHLNAEFGIKPFVSDVHDMVVELMHVAEKLAQLRRGVGKRHVAHYRQVLLDSGGGATDNKWSDFTGGFNSLHWNSSVRNDTTRSSGVRDRIRPYGRARWIRRPIYHATMRYSYTLPSMGEAEAEVAARLDTIGLRLDPSIVWNAIPFSFLVDWFVDVSGFLRSFAKDNFPIEVSVTDFCHSMNSLAEYEAGVWFTHASNTNDPSDYGPSLLGRYPYGSKDGPVYQADIAHTRIWSGLRGEYVRRLSSPSLHVARTKGASLRKAALAGSLLLQSKRSWNSRRYQKALSTFR